MTWIRLAWPPWPAVARIPRVPRGSRPPAQSALRSPIANRERTERMLGVLLWIALFALLFGLSR